MLRAVSFLLILAGVAVGGEDSPDLKTLLADLASPDYQTRRKAVLACEGREEPEVFERLLGMTRTDGNSNIRGFAAETLATFDDPRVFDRLAEMAKGEEFGVITSVYVALGRHGDARSLPILLTGLEAGRVTRGYAAKGLGLLGDPAAFGAVAKSYLAHLDDPYLHDLGAEALFRLDRERATALLLPRFAGMPSPARMGLARAMGGASSPAVTKAMIGHLASDVRLLRAAALTTLKLGRDAAATEALVTHLTDCPEDRDGTIAALAEIGDARALAALIDVLAAADRAPTRIQAIRALAKIGDRRAVSALVPRLDDRAETPQPQRISSIWGFPWNSRVDAAAVWAIRTLVDGKEPFDVGEISRFRAPVPPESVLAEIPKLKAWWAGLEDRAPFTLAQ